MLVPELPDAHTRVTAMCFKLGPDSKSGLPAILDSEALRFTGTRVYLLGLRLATWTFTFSRVFVSTTRSRRSYIRLRSTLVLCALFSFLCATFTAKVRLGTLTLEELIRHRRLLLHLVMARGCLILEYQVESGRRMTCRELILSCQVRS